eukprot:Gb_22828 [translate_table: standard]
MANVRDSFYRAAIGFVLAACSSFTGGSSLAQISGEEATRFIAGLAGNIGIKADRAATMVNAAVAAQTRSTFLQAWEQIGLPWAIQALLPDNPFPIFQLWYLVGVNFIGIKHVVD